VSKKGPWHVIRTIVKKSHQVISDENASFRGFDGAVVVVVELFVKYPDRFEASFVIGEVIQVPIFGLERTLEALVAAVR
jgi:hypothetical protein